MRRGPHPLMVHMGVAAANLYGIGKYTENFEASLSHDDAVEMVRGIQMYQSYDAAASRLPTQLIWRCGGVSILKPDLPDIHQQEGAVVLFIPSLINGSNIFDISEQRSFVRWLWAQGVRSYILDWGDLKDPDDIAMTFNDLVIERLVPAVQFLSKEYNQPIDIAGYCMGGTLLMGASPFLKESARSLTFMATPWDFSDAGSSLNRAVRIWTPYVTAEIERLGVLPSEWIQALFASYDPDGAARKFIKFALLDQSGDEAKLFVTVEDWLNDGVDIPAPIAEQFIDEWFFKNKPNNQEWVIDGHVIDPAKLNMPVHVIASKKDRLVTHVSASALSHSIPKKCLTTTSLECGHIGLMVGRDAQKNVWGRYHEWITKL